MPFIVVSRHLPGLEGCKTIGIYVPSFFALTIALATTLHPITVPSRFVLSISLTREVSVLNSSEE